MVLILDIGETMKCIPKREYLELEEFIDIMPENRKFPCKKIICDNYLRLRSAPGSKNNHQNWPGGWWDHTTEVMNIGQVVYETMNSRRELPFLFNETVFPLFMHDLEKPWKYASNEDLNSLNERLKEKGYQKPLSFPREEPHAFIIGLLEAYKVTLNDDEHNALEYAHGEIAQYSANHRLMLPLATFVHMCDVASARIWYDRPKENSTADSWGAKRIFEK